MKYLKTIPLAMCLSLFSLAGCDFLDNDESSNYDKQSVFESYRRAKQVVTNVYSYLPSDFCEVDGAMLDAATDDAVHVYKSSEIQRFVNGTWSPNHVADDVWGNYYEGIRAANTYLEEADKLTFDDWKFSDEYQDVMKDFKNYPYEVRFLRAFFYFELMKRYQNVPLIKDVLTVEQANQQLPTPYTQVADFILSECTDIAAHLPVNYSGFADKETGRITRGAALALKARVALYMASPLYGDYDSEKWKAAARAAYEIIKPASGLGYILDTNFNNLFGETNNKSKEVILARPVEVSGAFEQANFPMGVEKGRTSTCPTQNLMEAFEVKNTDGTSEPFDWNNPAMQANPYTNRDPRMASTIVYNRMKWPAQSEVEIWEGGANGLPLANATVTGYYLRKYLNKDISFASGSKVTAKQHNWVLFRYAEVLLNYAEAMVNAFHNPAYTDAEFPMSALEAVNMVRARKGVEMPAFPASISEADFLKRLKNERRVELAFEGHRFWDVRRWKELNKTADIYGVKIQNTASGDTYTKFLYDTRKIEEKMYFYPISNVERYKNSNLKQNKGW